MTIITPKARISYPHVFEPRAAAPGAEPMYSCSLVFEAGTDLSALKKAVIETARERFGDKSDALIKSGKLRLPFRTDVEEKGYPEGAVFINIRTKSKPGIVDRYAGTDGKPVPITDPDEIYPGCYVRASVRPYAYDTNGNRGVSLALCNIQKLEDGERFDGRKAAQDEFEALEESRKPVSANDLIGYGADEETPF